MKNLIEEIIKNKLDIEQYNDLFACAWNSGINKYCSIIENYNIITAPKQIKLSEIVSKLEKEFPKHNFYYRYDSNEPRIAICRYSCICVGVITLKDELDLTPTSQFNYPKWLYTLWVAGTEIVDDLESDDKC